MAKVSLALGESKSKVDLTLESKGSGKTFDTVGGTWDDHGNSTWNVQKEEAVLESKTKSNLTLEAK